MNGIRSWQNTSAALGEDHDGDVTTDPTRDTREAGAGVGQIRYNHTSQGQKG